jgi:hypothetical protein
MDDLALANRGLGVASRAAPQSASYPFSIGLALHLTAFRPPPSHSGGSASIRFTTLVRAGSFGRSIFSPYPINRKRMTWTSNRWAFIKTKSFHYSSI